MPRVVEGSIGEASEVDPSATSVRSRRNLGRRRLLKTSAALAGCIAAASYVTPSLRSLGVPRALALSAPGRTETPSVFQTGTLGRWSNSGNGQAAFSELWNTVQDPDW